MYQIKIITDKTKNKRNKLRFLFATKQEMLHSLASFRTLVGCKIEYRKVKYV